MAHVAPRQRDPRLRDHPDLRRPVGEGAAAGHPVGAQQLRQEVHQAGAADPLGRRIPDAPGLEGAVDEADGLDRAVGPGHPVPDAAALERRAGRAGRRQDPVPVRHDDLAVGADVHEQERAAPLHGLDGDQVRGRVRADMGRDQRPARDAGLRVHEHAQLVGAARDHRRGGLAVPPRRLGHRAVRQPPDRPDVQPEGEVAHRGVADHQHVDEPPAVDAQLRAESLQLVVERTPEGLAQLAGELGLVRDPGHDVAAAEPLRVLDRGHREDGPGLEVHQLDHDRGGADVDRDAHRAAGRRPEVRPVVRDHPAVQDPHDRVQLGQRIGRIRGQQDPQPAAQHDELQVTLRPLHGGLAGEPERGTQEGLRIRAGRQLVAARADLDHALVAAAGPAARGRDHDGQLRGIVEQEVAGHERASLGPVDDIGHSE